VRTSGVRYCLKIVKENIKGARFCSSSYIIYVKIEKDKRERRFINNTVTIFTRRSYTQNKFNFLNSKLNRLPFNDNDKFNKS